MDIPVLRPIFEWSRMTARLEIKASLQSPAYEVNVMSINP